MDDALRELLRAEALGGTEVDIALEAPTKDWAARRNAPTVNLYLYDIREDMRRRQRGLLNEYDDDGKVTARHLLPRYIKLSYLLTAWTQRPEDEHRLLSSLLAALLRFDALPPGSLVGSLADLGLPVPLTVALPPPEDRAFADVWTALGGELKPSLDVVISAPVDTGRRFPANTTAHEGMRLDTLGDDPVGHRPAPPGSAARQRGAPTTRPGWPTPVRRARPGAPDPGDVGEPRVAMARTRREQSD